MIELLKRTNLERVQRLAHTIWPVTFKEILSPQQVEYMLNWMYSIEKLESQFDAGHSFYVLVTENKDVGFLGLEHNYPVQDTLRIHKIYLLPATQGLGLGKELIQFTIGEAKRMNFKSVNLNVNRFNRATEFYKHLGFEIIREEDIEIGNGYLMEDFVMELKL